MELYLTFPAGAKTDYSAYLIHDSVTIDRRLMNDACKSIVDTCRFKLKYNQSLQTSLFTATDWIVFELNDDSSNSLFTGVIEPSFGLRKTTNVRPIEIEAIDNSYLLDKPINTSFNYPSAIGGSAYQIFNADDSSNNVVWELLEDAGYTPATDIDSGAPDLTTTVEYFQGTKDEESYREWIDDLLCEYGHVFYFDEDGEFTIYEWDKDTVTSTENIDEDVEIQKVNWRQDGFECEYAVTDTIDGARLWQWHSPITQTDGAWSFSGEGVAANDYWPPDGDIDDIYQDYSTQWLDVPWLNRETRLKNKDIRLIAADVTDSDVETFAESGISIYSSSYEARRSKVLWKNTADATKTIDALEIKGKALFRKYRRYTRCPDTATNPMKYTARFLYDETQATVQANAQRFARAMDRWRTYGNYKYMWTDRTDRSIGTIVTINMTNPSINQTVMITRKRWNPDRTVYSYTARGISAYTATTVADRGDAPASTDTTEKTIKDIADGGVLGDGSVVGVSQNSSANPTSRASRVYLGHMSGDNGQGLYFKEYNGVNWENRGYMRLRDPSTWLVVDDLGFGMSFDNVGVS